MTKITYIGGGSAYAAGLLRALIASGDFAGCEVALTDIDRDGLALIAQLGQRMANAAGSDITISATTDRAAALAGADLVFTSFRVGGFAARARDEQIPLQYGVIGQETVGPGGFAFALRSLPVVRAICDDMERHCPEAWLLNYTNPTNIVAEAVARYSTVKCVSICDQVYGDARRVAEILGRPDAAIDLRVMGLNHATWSTRFLLDGEDALPLIAAASDEVQQRGDVAPMHKRMFRLAARYGRLPNEYMQYYYFHEETLAELRAKPRTRAQQIMAELPEVLAHYREQSAQERPHLTRTRGGSDFGDMAVDVMRALLQPKGAHNSPEIHLLNVPNSGALPGLPPERVAEVPCLVDSVGYTPLAQPPLPSELRGLLLALAEYQALAAEAGWTGDRDVARRALGANPLVWKLDLDQIDALFEELMAANEAVRT